MGGRRGEGGRGSTAAATAIAGLAGEWRWSRRALLQPEGRIVAVAIRGSVAAARPSSRSSGTRLIDSGRRRHSPRFRRDRLLPRSQHGRTPGPGGSVLVSLAMPAHELPQGDESPDDFDRSERPHSSKEAVRGGRPTGESEGQGAPGRLRLERVEHHHRADGHDAERGEPIHDDTLPPPTSGATAAFDLWRRRASRAGLPPK